jgi:hypothetical protein
MDLDPTEQLTGADEAASEGTVLYNSSSPDDIPSSAEVVGTHQMDIEVEEVKELVEPSDERQPYLAKLRTEFGYEFRDRLLRNCETGEPFKFVDQKHYERLGDLILEYIQEQMRTTYNLTEVLLPLEGEGPKSNIFISPDIATNRKGLLILIQGAGAVRAGQWARSVCINDSLDTGTVFPCLEFARAEEWAVIVLNPNFTFTAEGRVRHSQQPIPVVNTPERHCQYVWEQFVKSSPAEKLYIIGHSCGGMCTVSLLHTNTQDFIDRVQAIALSDSVHGSMYGVNKEGKAYFKKCAVDWVASSEALGKFLSSASKSYNGCVNVSSGHRKHEYTTGSAHPQIFEFFRRMQLDKEYLSREGEFLEWTNSFA